MNIPVQEKKKGEKNIKPMKAVKLGSHYCYHATVLGTRPVAAIGGI